MTPALAQTSVFSTLSTRAVIVPLPVRLKYANWNWSEVPWMSEPAPLTV